MRYTPAVPPPYLGLEACPAIQFPTARRRSDARLDPADLAAPLAGSTLRAKARQLGVSHEAVRQAMIAAGLPTDSASRNRAIREMATPGVPWPEIARAFGMSPAGVRYVCRDLPPRPTGRRPRRGDESDQSHRSQ